MSLRRLLHRIVHDMEDGITLCAKAINADRASSITEQSLINKLNTSPNDHLNIRDAERLITRANGDLAVARYFAEKANAIVVVLPSVPESDMALLDDFMKIATELGETSARFQQGFADGVITEKEFSAISKEVNDTVAALLAFQKSVERVVR